MAVSKISGISIRGLVVTVPKNEVSISRDEAFLFNNNTDQIERIKRTIGLDRRRVVSGDMTAADLSESAVRRLIMETDIDPATVDGLIMVTQTPDYLQPGNAVILHGRLDLSETCACMDINLGCSGYVYGLWTVFSLIASGGLRRVILVAGDTVSRIVAKEDRALRPLFGDASSATLIESDAVAPETVFDLRSDGRGYQALWQPGGGFREPWDERNSIPQKQSEGVSRSRCDLHMDGSEIFNFSLKVEPPAIRDILSESGWHTDEVDGFVFHQANRYIIDNIRRRLKLPEDKVPCGTVEKFGNQSSASIPATLVDHYGNKLLNKSHKLILSGFGVGLSWATCSVDLQPVLCSCLEEI